MSEKAGKGTVYHEIEKATGMSYKEIYAKTAKVADEEHGIPPAGKAYIPRLFIPSDDISREEIAKPKPLAGNADDEDGVVQWHPVKGKDPKPVCCPANVYQFLTTHLRGRTICRNEMTEEIEIDKTPVTEDAISKIHRELDRCSDVGGWSRAHIEATLAELAAQNPKRSPVRDYLNSLIWDGVGRVSSVVGNALKTRYEHPIYKTFLEKFFLSAVARAMQPGCKADLVLILQSPKQGTRKSTFFETLAFKREWFSDSMQGITDKDAKMDTGRRWIIEWSELSSTKSASHNALKAFVSSNTDQFRPPYAKQMIEKPRMCIIVGTTNDGTFFDAMQGERRFMIVPVEQIDIDWIRQNRDQLWAEALHRWRAGESHWIDDSMVDQQHEANSIARTIDPWEDVINDWIESEGTRIHGDMEYIIADEAQTACLKGVPREWTKNDQMRLASVLRGLGFERTTNPVTVPEGRKRLWVMAPK